MGGEKVRRYLRSRTPRMQWTAELHNSFLQAIDRLGGAHHATPKLILLVMGVKGLTIAHVKSHLQMYRGPSIRRGKKDVQPQLQRKHSCAADGQGGPEAAFMCPPLKRARMGTETTQEDEGMKGSQGISEVKNTGAGTRYCIDDYMQAMAMERGIKDEGLRWQTGAAASSLQTVPCLEQRSGDSKLIKPEARFPVPVVKQQEGPNENNGISCFLFSRGVRHAIPTQQCSLSLSLRLDPKGFNAVSSSPLSPPSDGSCIMSSSSPRRSSSGCSGHWGSFDAAGVNLELSLSI